MFCTSYISLLLLLLLLLLVVVVLVLVYSPLLVSDSGFLISPELKEICSSTLQMVTMSLLLLVVVVAAVLTFDLHFTGSVRYLQLSQTVSGIRLNQRKEIHPIP